MSNNLEKPIPDVKVNDDTAATIAAIFNVSKRYVNMVIAGDRYHPGILKSYMELRELKSVAIDVVRKNALTEAVERLVPIK